MAAQEFDRMLTRKEVADIFGIQPKTVYKWVYEGKLQAPDTISPRYARFPLSRVKEDYFRRFGRPLTLEAA